MKIGDQEKLHAILLTLGNVFDCAFFVVSQAKSKTKLEIAKELRADITKFLENSKHEKIKEVKD